jgi:hypothetical protein
VYATIKSLLFKIAKDVKWALGYFSRYSMLFSSIKQTMRKYCFKVKVEEGRLNNKIYFEYSKFGRCVL